MRYLLSSLILAVCFSCGSYPKKNGFTATANSKENIVNPYFSNTSKDYVYKANINVFDKVLGGIFIVKKLGENHHRVVFTTEMGNKIFDFTFLGDDFKVNHILKDIDKKILINILKNDFRVLVAENPSIENTFFKNPDSIYETRIGTKKYYHFLSEKKLHKVIRVSNGKEKIEFLFSKINDDIAKEIQIMHKNIKLEINLKSF